MGTRDWLALTAKLNRPTISLEINPHKDCPTERLDVEGYKRKSTRCRETKKKKKSRVQKSKFREALHPYSFWVYWNHNLLRSVVSDIICA